MAHIPNDMMEKAQLPALPYTSQLDALAEKFDAKPAFSVTPSYARLVDGVF